MLFLLYGKTVLLKLKLIAGNIICDAGEFNYTKPCPVSM